MPSGSKVVEECRSVKLFDKYVVTNSSCLRSVDSLPTLQASTLPCVQHGVAPGFFGLQAGLNTPGTTQHILHRKHTTYRPHQSDAFAACVPLYITYRGGYEAGVLQLQTQIFFTQAHACSSKCRLQSADRLSVCCLYLCWCAYFTTVRLRAKPCFHYMTVVLARCE